MNEEKTIKSLKWQAQNTKGLMDTLNKAYLGMTTEEILRLALGDKGERKADDKDDDDRANGGRT